MATSLPRHVDGGAPDSAPLVGTPSPKKAKRLRISSEKTVDAALAVIFKASDKQRAVNEAPALAGLDPEGVHQMRIALRRMRCAVAVFRKVIPATQVAWLKHEIASLLKSLSMVRDWDVFLKELLAPIEAARPSDPGLSELRAAAEEERAEGYDNFRKEVHSGTILLCGSG